MSLLELQQSGFAELLNLQGASRAASDEGPSSLHLISPREVTNKMRALDVEFATLDATIKTQPPGVVSEAFITPWNAQLTDWRRFVTDNQSEARMVITGTGTLSRQIDQYRAKLIGWNQSFRTQFPAAVPVGPGPAPLPQNPPSAPSSGLPWWVTSLLTAAVIGGVGYIGYSAYQSVKGASKVVSLVRGKRDEDEPRSETRLDRRFLPYALPPRRETVQGDE